MTWFLSAGIVIVLALAAIWYFNGPAGVLRVVVEKPAASHGDEVVNLFQAATLRVDQISRDFAVLALAAPELVDRVPGLPGPTEVATEDIVKWKGKFKIGGESLNAEGSFDGNALMKAAYNWIGLTDYFLVVESYGTCDGQTSGSPLPCLKIVARLWPVEKRPTAFIGSNDEIADGLAMYLFKAYLRQQKRVRLTERQDDLGASVSTQFTNSTASLRRTAYGFDLLRKGIVHPECFGNYRDEDERLLECVRRTRRAFEEALTVDKANPHAYFGLSLLFFREALDSAMAGGRVVRVNDSLTAASRNLGAALELSSFIRSALSGQLQLDRFSLVWSGSFKSLSPAFVRTAHLYGCAWRSYVEADYKRQLAFLERIRDMPKELSPYIDGYSYEAKLNLSDADASLLLRQLNELRRTRPRDWVYNIIYGSQACRRGVDPAGAMQALEEAALDSNEILSRDALIWRSTCFVQQRQIAKGKEAVKPVVDFIQANASHYPEDEIRTLYVDLGYFYIALGDYEAATGAFRKAVGSPAISRRVQIDPQLGQWRAHRSYNEVLTEIARHQRSPAQSFLCERELEK